jgi:predicted dehydrogenase
MTHHTNRRSFLQTTAAAGIGFWVAGGIHAAESKSPNEKIHVASIGIGGKGCSDSNDAEKMGVTVAICDVDAITLGAGEKRFPGAKRYTDFRKMLDEMGKSIDAVTVSTPDHTHTAASLMAMRMGKHCFCQKPLTRTIYEARLMAKVAREQKVATQMGNQGTSSSSLRKAVALIQSGVIGNAKEVHVWTDRPMWPCGCGRPNSVECPSNLQWDLWLGPASLRPFANGYHPSSWRGWWDFGSGALGDMACHTVNMPYMALNLRDPVTIQAECSGHNGDSFPKWSVITFEFPAIDKRPAVKMIWYDGGKCPDKKMLDDKPWSSCGCLVVGNKGRMYTEGAYSGDIHLLDTQDSPDVKWEESPGHVEEWERAIRGGKPAMSNFPDYAGGLTETILLGNLAVWAAATGQGPKVEWDSKNLRSPNMPELEAIIKPKYRSGYTLDV